MDRLREMYTGKRDQKRETEGQRERGCPERFRKGRGETRE